MTELVLPEDSNPHGNVFGGRVVALIDKCAAIAAMRHCRSEVVTVSLDSVEFRTPVKVGEMLLLHGRLNAVFRSSVEVEVRVDSEHPLTGERKLTTRAFVTFVAVGPDGRPVEVPPLLAESPEEAERASAAAERRKARLALRGR